MKLSPNFTLDEFTRSATAAHLGIDNTPTSEAIASMIKLCEAVLEPIRAHFGKPVIITSGYRSRALNRAVSGAPGSQHMSGEAADFQVSQTPKEIVLDFIQSRIDYDQVIDYGPKSLHVHISYRASRNRKNFIRNY